MAMKEVIGFPDGLPDLEGTGDRLKQPLPLIEAEKQRRPQPDGEQDGKGKREKDPAFQGQPAPPLPNSLIVNCRFLQRGMGQVCAQIETERNAFPMSLGP